MTSDELKTSNGTKTILVADDHTITSEMICAVLEGAGYALVSASDGVEAVQRAYKECPDLIVLDLFMPRMNGYQVCRLLKSDPVAANIPILILTASFTFAFLSSSAPGVRC